MNSYKEIANSHLDDFTHGSHHFVRMRDKVEELYPNITKGQIIYACNKIGNFIRSAHVDMYNITLSDVPLYGLKLAEIEFEVEVGGVVIYLWAETD
jgi:hypothetical protein